MTVNSEFQYVQAAAVSRRCDESAIRCAVCSKKWPVRLCSKSITRKPLRSAFAGSGRRCRARLVAEVEPDPDHDLEPEVPIPARKNAAAGCHHCGHPLILVGRGGGSESSAADVRHLDLRKTCLCGSQLGIAVGAAAPDAAQQLAQLVVGGAEAERRAKVVAAQREETRVEAALRAEARAGAAAAEGLRDRGDDADLAGAVLVAEAAGGLVCAGGLERLERPDGVDPRDDLRRRRRRRRAASRSCCRRPCTR